MSGDRGLLGSIRPTLLLPVVILVVLGVLFISSASFDARSGTYLSYGKKQIIWAAAGMIAFLVARLLPYEKVADRAYLFYGGGLILLLALPFVGTAVHGAKRWIVFGPVRITPSEFMKLGLVFGLARCLRFRREELAQLQGYILPCVITAVPLLIVLTQPDLGTSLTFIPALFVMLYVAGARRGVLAFGGAAMAVAAPLAFFFVLHKYQRLRLLAFWNPEKYALDVAYQSIQSVIAVGNGGLDGADTGVGAMGRMGFVPARHTDFIFTVVAEEGGFIVATAVLLVLLWLLVALLEVAAQTREPFGRLVAAGVTAILGTQVLVNVAMTLGCGPVTGLPLPFLSYGGSSLVLWCAATGYIHGIATRPLRQFGSQDGPDARVI